MKSILATSALPATLLFIPVFSMILLVCSIFDDLSVSAAVLCEIFALTTSMIELDTSSATDNKSTISDKSTSLVVSSNEGDTREIASGVHTGNIDASNVISSSTTTIKKTKTSECLP
jgi:hypothetical protein